MRTPDLLLVATYTLTSTAAVVLVKQHVGPAAEAWGRAPGPSVPGALLATGAALYVASFLLWMLILSRNELSVVYPMMVGLTLVSTTVAAWAILGEQLSPVRIVGIAVIFAGVALVTRS